MANFCTQCGSHLNDEGKCPICSHNFEEIKELDMKPQNVIDMATQKINELAGESGAVQLNVGDVFSQVLKKHTTAESEEIFISGTAKTTPDEKDISTTWPKPWLFSRVFIMFLITYILLFICFDVFNNSNALPGMIFIGAIAVPFSLVVFFMEVNAPRNLSFFETMKIFFIGGGASLVAALILFSATESLDGYVGAIIVGVIEETAKAVIIAWFLSRLDKIKFVLTGLLVGASVGAGFAAFETAGYILNFGLEYGKTVMFDVLVARALLAPGGHVIWGAIIGGALVLVKGNNALSFEHIRDKKFISFFAMCVVMHAIWDFPINVKYYLIQIAMTVCAWIIAFVLIDVGLKEISRINSHKAETEEYELTGGNNQINQ